ncbi:sphingomyelin phosphodiesterase 2-like [Oppia nitens]|uniref:sphingomyelin phosphodiesterase 2-like n=1 Tax=Oppia nitens TaxID=1686743 RepID=UPI0023DA1C53|nr:sphingomyelin phosphodiesterase 2-like [Oppia nitens]
MDQIITETSIKIFTLNCWGLWKVAKHREQRINIIANHLANHDYDIVFLQEVWVQSDFEQIWKATESKFKFAHMFKNGSVLGNSGLAILVKWVPKVFHFHPFSVNGSPFQVTHGDWYTSKGIGYVRIELDSLNLHLFCTHMHAQYDEEEKLNDQYSVHRICQSFEMSKFIKSMTNCRSNAKDFIILAGDMNTSSKELPYRLLVDLLELKDCFKFRTKTMADNVFAAAGDSLTNDYTDSEMSDDEFHTCGHRDNTYTEKNTNGKRIDFILYRLTDSVYNKNNELISESHFEPFGKYFCVEHHMVHSKDESGMSFSDHQPVVAQFTIRLTDISSDLKSNSNTNTVNENHCNGNNTHNGVNGNNGNCMAKGGGCVQYRKVHERRGSGGMGDQSHTYKEMDSSDVKGLLSCKSKLKSNILLETATKMVKNGPLQLKHIASNAIRSKYGINSGKRLTLERVRHQLDVYVADNQLTLKSFVYLFLLFLLFLCFFIWIITMAVNVSILEASLLILLLSVFAFVCLFFKFLASRQEKNAIKAIINDIDKEILLYN